MKIPTSSHTHDTQTQSNNLWITLRVAPYGNRTRYTLHGGSCPATALTIQSYCIFRNVPPPRGTRTTRDPRLAAPASYQLGNRKCRSVLLGSYLATPPWQTGKLFRSKVTHYRSAPAGDRSATSLGSLAGLVSPPRRWLSATLSPPDPKTSDSFRFDR
uniref:SFRICE_001133 n=1 Tax=Spodoptera frugiperda TaxID=7108 RepID=A0A2H1VFQ0_SPOFR